MATPSDGYEVCFAADTQGYCSKFFADGKELKQNDVVFTTKGLGDAMKAAKGFRKTTLQTDCRLSQIGGSMNRTITWVCSCSRQSDTSGAKSRKGSSRRQGNSRRQADCKVRLRLHIEPFVAFQHLGLTDASPATNDESPVTNDESPATKRCRRDQKKCPHCSLKASPAELHKHLYYDPSSKCRKRKVRALLNDPTTTCVVYVADIHTQHEGHGPAPKALRLSAEEQTMMKNLLGAQPKGQTRSNLIDWVKRVHPNEVVEYQQLYNIETSMKACEQSNVVPNDKTGTTSSFVGSMAIDNDMAFLLKGRNEQGREFLLAKLFDLPHMIFFPSGDVRAVFFDDDRAVTPECDGPGSALGEVPPERVTNLLCIRNKHPRDKRLLFSSKDHVYWIDGKCSFVESVTQLLSRYYLTPRQHVMAHSKYRACRQDGHERCEYCSCECVADVLRIFKGKQQEGVAMHQKLARFLEGLEGLPEELATAITHFLENHQLQAYRTEWGVFDEQSQLAGTIDAVFQVGNDDDNVAIVDFKNVPFDKQDVRHECLLKDCAASNLGKWTMQLNLYRHILETHYGKKVKNMYVVMIEGTNILPVSVQPMPGPLTAVITARQLQVRLLLNAKKQLHSQVQGETTPHSGSRATALDAGRSAVSQQHHRVPTATTVGGAPAPATYPTPIITTSAVASPTPCAHLPTTAPSTPSRCRSTHSPSGATMSMTRPSLIGTRTATAASAWIPALSTTTAAAAASRSNTRRSLSDVTITEAAADSQSLRSSTRTGGTLSTCSVAFLGTFAIATRLLKAKAEQLGIKCSEKIDGANIIVVGKQPDQRQLWLSKFRGACEWRLNDLWRACLQAKRVAFVACQPTSLCVKLQMEVVQSPRQAHVLVVAANEVTRCDTPTIQFNETHFKAILRTLFPPIPVMHSEVGETVPMAVPETPLPLQKTREAKKTTGSSSLMNDAPQRQPRNGGDEIQGSAWKAHVIPVDSSHAYAAPRSFDATATRHWRSVRAAQFVYNGLLEASNGDKDLQIEAAVFMVCCRPWFHFVCCFHHSQLHLHFKSNATT